MPKFITKELLPPFLGQQRGESNQAFFLFQRYAELDRKERTLKKLSEVTKAKQATLLRYFTIWSWDIRIKELEAKEPLVEVLKNNESFVESARQIAQIESQRMLQVVINIALDEDVKPSVRLSAAKDVLDRAGIIPPKRIELTRVNDIEGIENKIKSKLRKLNDADLERLALIFDEELEGL